MLRLLCIFAILLPGLAVELPPGGKRLVSADKVTLKQIGVRLGNGAFGTHELRAVEHAEFASSLALTITKQPPNTWDAALSIYADTQIDKGDSLLVGFWARGKSAGGGGVGELVFERAGNPYTKSVQYLVETPDDGKWQKFWVRFQCKEKYAPGEAAIHFQLGYTPCSFELAGLEAWNFGGTKLEALPHTPLSYHGREADAAWRATAQQRIERHRKAPMTVTVLDALGQPVAGVPVRVHMDRLDFDMGSAVKAQLLVQDSEAAEKYRETFLRYFNLGVIENGLKWRQWDSHHIQRARSLAALDWLQEQGIPARGHVMVWPGFRYLPPWLKSLTDKPDALRAVVNAHIREAGYAVGDRVRDWDVVNELYDNRELTAILGKEESLQWFKQAQQVAPQTKRFYNDYAALVRGGFPTGHKDHFEETLRYLIDNKAPIDAIGIQGHFGSLLTAPERLYTELDRWAGLGQPILITEYDVTVPNAELRADFTRDFLTTCFSHPNVQGVVTWGFWSKAQWRPESALFAEDWQPTLMGQQWIKLVSQWRTDETLTTNANGQVKLRAFLGDYTIGTAGREQKLRHRQGGTHLKMQP
jgi:endo-1,4-beta-xylanase